jgi:hypothetical protein
MCVGYAALHVRFVVHTAALQLLDSITAIICCHVLCLVLKGQPGSLYVVVD